MGTVRQMTKSEIKNGNGIEALKSPESDNVCVAPNVPGSVRRTHMSMKLDDRG
jgi:hypothetical protein